MKDRLSPILNVSLVLAILLSLTLLLIAGSLCLWARAVSGCQQCCQPVQAETQARISGCSLFCCSGLPGGLEVPIPSVLNLTVALPGLHDLSVSLKPAPPPPRFSLSIQDRRL